MIGRSVALAATVALLGSCTGDDPLMRSQPDTAGGGTQQQQDARQDTAQQASSQSQQDTSEKQTAQTGDADVPEGQMPGLGTTRFKPEPLPDFEPTDTFVGEKVQQFRKDLGKLKNNVGQQNAQLQDLRAKARQAARRYHGLVADIQAQLQTGTTPGNPRLVKKWNQAQAELERVDQVVKRMNELSNQVSSTSALAGFLLQSISSSYGLSGAVEADHAHLRALEDSANQTMVLVDRLLNELSKDVSRQNSYLSRERRNLSMLSLAIKNGEFYGQSLANRADVQPAAPDGRATGDVDISGREPLVVIRFDSEEVEYQQPLYNAVQRALDNNAKATFQVVAVAPQSDQRAKTALNRSQSRQHAEDVLRSLNEMGLPPNRVSLAATTSQQAEVNQVHIYLE
ncbi:hypothetical protein [Limimonas halophila]|nr:hypothetical protein [Limimonas halophila]